MAQELTSKKKKPSPHHGHHHQPDVGPLPYLGLSVHDAVAMCTWTTTVLEGSRFGKDGPSIYGGGAIGRRARQHNQQQQQHQRVHAPTASSKPATPAAAAHPQELGEASATLNTSTATLLVSTEEGAEQQQPPSSPLATSASGANLKTEESASEVGENTEQQQQQELHSPDSASVSSLSDGGADAKENKDSARRGGSSNAIRPKPLSQSRITRMHVVQEKLRKREEKQAERKAEREAIHLQAAKGTRVETMPSSQWLRRTAGRLDMGPGSEAFHDAGVKDFRKTAKMWPMYHQHILEKNDDEHIL